MTQYTFTDLWKDLKLMRTLTKGIWKFLFSIRSCSMLIFPTLKVKIQILPLSPQSNVLSYIWMAAVICRHEKKFVFKNVYCANYRSAIERTKQNNKCWNIKCLWRQFNRTPFNYTSWNKHSLIFVTFIYRKWFDII